MELKRVLKSEGIGFGGIALEPMAVDKAHMGG